MTKNIFKAVFIILQQNNIKIISINGKYRGHFILSAFQTPIG